MELLGAFLVSVVVVLLLLVVLAYGWWQIGWTRRVYHSGDVVTFGASGKSLDSITFRKCVFTTKSPKGHTESWDVTSQLNSMAQAYAPSGKSKAALPGQDSFSLGGSEKVPLNPFSFSKPGFNDKAAVPDPTAWKKMPATLTVNYRTG